MAVETIQYRIDGGAWVDGGTGSVSLTGLSPGTMYMFEVRAKDDSDNYSGVSRKFYATTPYLLAMLTDENGDAIIDDSGNAIAVFQGDYLGRA